MPRPRRLFFADVQTPLSLTPYGYAALPDHDMALQQHTDQGMVFRVEADTAQHAAEQVIAGSEPIAWVAGQLDPRLLPPLLQSDQPPDLPDVPNDPSSDHDGGGGGWGQGWDEDPGGGWSWQ